VSPEGCSYSLIHCFNGESRDGNKVSKGINERDNWIKDEDNKKIPAEFRRTFPPVYNN
jgi:hypothetical protein